MVTTWVSTDFSEIVIVKDPGVFVFQPGLKFLAPLGVSYT